MNSYWTNVSVTIEVTTLEMGEKSSCLHGFVLVACDGAKIQESREHQDLILYRVSPGRTNSGHELCPTDEGS